jgi:opacity protein-like surface antigen
MKMTKYILTAVIIVLAASLSTAQKIRLNGYSAYIFNDNIDSRYDANNYYDGTIEGGYQWGVGLEFMASKTVGIEIKYLRQDATAPMTYANGAGVKNKDFDLGINYILLGGTNYFQLSGKVEPFIGAGLGAAIIDIKNPLPGGESSKTKFAFDIKGGTNIWFSDKAGLKLQVELLSAVQGAGGGFYFGTGGSGAGVSTYSTMLQFGLGGGLVFKFGK